MALNSYIIIKIVIDYCEVLQIIKKEMLFHDISGFMLIRQVLKCDLLSIQREEKS